MGGDSPLVTIGITVFNAAATVERAIVSALNQTWSNVDIVIVDDASSDESFDIVNAFAHAHPSIRCYRNCTNMGVAATRNRIVQEAKGEYCCFFDDDDLSLANRVEGQIRKLRQFEKRNDAPVICHCARTYKSLCGRTAYLPALDAEDGERVALMILSGKPLRSVFGDGPACTQMGKTEIYRSMGGFDENLRRCEDTEFNLRFALRGGYFVATREALVEQYQTEGEDKGSDKEIVSWRYILQKHQDLLVRHHLLRFSRSWLEIKFSLWKGERYQAGMKAIRLMAFHPLLGLSRLYGLLRRKFTPRLPSREQISCQHK